MEPLYSCRYCQRTLPASEFLPDKRRKTGIDLCCRDCFNSRRQNQRIAIHNPPRMEGDKRCSGCKVVKPITEFSRNPKMVDGRANWCKSCLKKYRVERHKREPDYFAAISRRKNRKLRLEVLTYYSGGPPTCACCGENHFEFLAIDHINGGGNKHRKEVGTSTMYNWLRKHNFPEGFRVLCHNCNLAIGFYGTCPHETEQR